VIFDMRTSLFARCDFAMVTNRAADFQVHRGERSMSFVTELFRCAEGRFTHDGSTTARQHSDLGLYFPVSAGAGP
jgi:hypothetical protein